MASKRRRKRAAGGNRRQRPGTSSPSSPSPPSLYIVSPTYDWLLFLGSPLIALAAGFFVSSSSFANADYEFHGFEVIGSELLMGILIQAHLVAVFFRSHGNPQIRKLHPIRFFVVPVALYLAMVTSNWIFVAVSVTTTFWDVYHSGMQTFGFGRIYDQKIGNDPLVGRYLDWALNILLYAGPIVGGATMMDHFEDFHEFADVGNVFFTRIPAMMEGIHGTLAVGILTAGFIFVLAYVLAYWRFQQQGYRVSWLKVWLYASTGITSIYAWGFNAFGEAFLIMNLFHAVQYFGIVWAREKSQMTNRLGVAQRSWGKPVALVVFLGLTGGFGYWVETIGTNAHEVWAITLVVSIMHFWYDGFIWSVRRKEV